MLQSLLLEWYPTLTRRGIGKEGCKEGIDPGRDGVTVGTGRPPWYQYPVRRHAAPALSSLPPYRVWFSCLFIHNRTNGTIPLQSGQNASRQHKRQPQPKRLRGRTFDLLKLRFQVPWGVREDAFWFRRRILVPAWQSVIVTAPLVWTLFFFVLNQGTCGIWHQSRLPLSMTCSSID